MRVFRSLLALLSLALLGIGSARAQPTHIAAKLLADEPIAAGSTGTVALLMTPERGWHGYWSNPGDAGFGMTLAWTLPAGVKAGAPRYPVPQTLVVGGLMNHVYESQYAVLVPITLPWHAPAGARLPILVKAEWLACTDKVCVPERAELATEVTVAPAGAHPPSDPRFDTWRARLPAPLGSIGQFAVGGGTIRFAIPLPRTAALDRPHLFVADDHVVDYAAPQRFARDGDRLIVSLKRAVGSAQPLTSIHALLRMNPAGDGVSFAAVPGPVPTGGTPIGDTAPPSLAWLALAALAGGLLLNLMPCVFPILSLKALSLARAGESEEHARRDGLTYAAGVIVACVGLGALLLALRAGGAQVGWAFQLQEPGVVVALLLLAVAITANFAGLYEFAVPGFVGESRSSGAFATGLLAAFVATPCTGPFMAAAMGAALLLPVPAALLLFAALGLGIALPFVAIAFVPALRRALPRPGAWMERFRHVLAVPMGLTALGLLWLTYRLGGQRFAVAAAAAAVAVIAMLILTGRRQRGGQAARLPAAGAVLVGLVAVLALTPAIDARPPASSGLLHAQPFSEAALTAARAAGKPVFVWMTADWCLTCKVNEEVAIERETTRAAFAKAGVVVLRGDWTRRDPAITGYLTAQGAAGVPLYMWYPAGGRPPRQLPQVLTPGVLSSLPSSSG